MVETFLTKITVFTIILQQLHEQVSCNIQTHLHQHTFSGMFKFKFWGYSNDIPDFIFQGHHVWIVCIND